jgi:hypothetical protein
LTLEEKKHAYTDKVDTTNKELVKIVRIEDVFNYKIQVKARLHSQTHIFTFSCMTRDRTYNKHYFNDTKFHEKTNNYLSKSRHLNIFGVV